MKKLLKITGVLFLCALVVGVGGIFALKKMYPPEKVKALIVDSAREKLHREVTFDKLSFNWVGFKLTNFAMSEASTFAEGTFVKADELVVKVAFKPLLQKRVEIDKISVNGLELNIIKNKDGSFNFDSFSSGGNSAEEETPADEAQDTPMVLLAQYIVLHNCTISYKDLESGLSAVVKRLSIVITDFDLANPFKVKINFTSNVKLSAAHPQAAIPAELDLTVSLANLNMADAYVTLDSAAASYQTAKLTLRGDVKDFTKPNLNLSGTLTGINSELLKDFAPDLPTFTLPDVKMILQTAADLDAQSLSLNQATVSLADSTFSVGGWLSWKDPAVKYNTKGTLSLDLAQAVQMADTMTDLRPTGTISGTFAATDKNNFQDISGVLSIKDTRLIYDNIVLSNLNGTITAKSLDDISSSDLTGLLNNEKVTASFSYKNIKDVMNVVFKMHLDKLKLDAFPGSNAPATGENTPKEETAVAEKTEESPANWRMNLKADVSAGEIQVPYFKTGGMVLSADLTDITPNFDRANGQVSFDFQPGAITDLDSVLFQNKIVKILLLPLSLVRKVTEILNMDIFPKEKGSLAFTEASGDYTLTDGLMTLNKTVFKSKLTDISGDGTINFKNEALDMKMKASVTSITQGTPMVIKITGTVSDPKGKLDVLNTVGSVVGGILTGKMALSTAKTGTDLATGAVTGTAKTAAGAVTGTAKTAVGAVKALGGLFKKNKDKEDGTETAEAAAESAAETPAVQTTETPAE